MIKLVGFLPYHGDVQIRKKMVEDSFLSNLLSVKLPVVVVEVWRIVVATVLWSI